MSLLAWFVFILVFYKIGRDGLTLEAGFLHHFSVGRDAASKCPFTLTSFLECAFTWPRYENSLAQSLLAVPASCVHNCECAMHVLSVCAYAALYVHDLLCSCAHVYVCAQWVSMYSVRICCVHIECVWVCCIVSVYISVLCASVYVCACWMCVYCGTHVLCTPMCCVNLCPCVCTGIAVLCLLVCV